MKLFERHRPTLLHEHAFDDDNSGNNSDWLAGADNENSGFQLVQITPEFRSCQMRLRSTLETRFHGEIRSDKVASVADRPAAQPFAFRQIFYLTNMCNSQCLLQCQPRASAHRALVRTTVVKQHRQQTRRAAQPCCCSAAGETHCTEFSLSDALLTEQLDLTPEWLSQEARHLLCILARPWSPFRYHDNAVRSCRARSKLCCRPLLKNKRRSDLSDTSPWSTA